jgi:sugar O-acyltransferase (sialic acid O-acetyltransferase NeuD family)
MNTEKLIIFGAGETARLAYEYFTWDSPRRVVGFVVDDAYKASTGGVFMDCPVVSFTESLSAFPPGEHDAFVAVASARLNHSRRELFERVRVMGYNLASYVSTRAFVWRDVVIGDNCFVLENNVLQSGVIIGENTTLWSGNHVGHRTTISSHCFLTSHVVVSGFCHIGEHSFLGVNSSIADKVHIASHNFIGMGAVVNKKTDEDAIYTGNPAEKSKLSAKRFCKV